MLIHSKKKFKYVIFIFLYFNQKMSFCLIHFFCGACLIYLYLIIVRNKDAMVLFLIFILRTKASSTNCLRFGAKIIKCNL